MNSTNTNTALETKLIALGGKLWNSGERRRIYFNDVAEFVGLEVTRYKTGNISSATLNGAHISNTKAAQMLNSLGSVYFDCVTGKWSKPEIGALIMNNVEAITPEPTPEEVACKVAENAQAFAEFAVPALETAGFKAELIAGNGFYRITGADGVVCGAMPPVWTRSELIRRASMLERKHEIASALSQGRAAYESARK